jgi:2-keto-4-pentenoate hydratase
VIDDRLTFALQQQLLEWRAELATGAERVGWKIGRRVGPHPVVGHLTSATRLDPGATFDAAGTTDLRADAELAVEIGEHGEPAGFAAALELVDYDRPTDDLDAVVASNCFHRAFVLSPAVPHLPESTQARVLVDGEVRAEAPAAYDPELLEGAVEWLGTAGERLEPGDRVLTGAVVQVPVARGQEVEVDLGELGRLGVTIS